MMENDNLKKAFDFLIKDYLCEYQYVSDFGDHYYYLKSRFKVQIYEWSEFNEIDINLIIDDECYNIDPHLEEPLEYSRLQKSNKGIKGFFFNYDKNYWELVAKIVVRKIKELI